MDDFGPTVGQPEPNSSVAEEPVAVVLGVCFRWAELGAAGGDGGDRPQLRAPQGKLLQILFCCHRLHAQRVADHARAQPPHLP